MKTSRIAIARAAHGGGDSSLPHQSSCAGGAHPRGKAGASDARHAHYFTDASAPPARRWESADWSQPLRHAPADQMRRLQNEGQR
jgi:hypothetical protein